MIVDELIIGSHAMRHWFPDFKREPKDLDRMSIKSLTTREVQNYWVPSFSLILDRNKDSTYIDPDLLLTLKVSHAGWDIQWEKTMYDILFLKFKGYTVDKDLYHALVKDWIKVHGKRWASLKGKDSTTFFQDAVERKYVHDDIHNAVAVYDKPLYERLIIDGVSCGEDAFELLSQKDKILLVKEEVWVTALERYLIPSDFKHNKRDAYYQSLKKLATTMSSGYFKYFILSNWEQLYNCKDFTYIDKFKKAEQENKLQKYENNKSN